MPILTKPLWENYCRAFVRGETAGNRVASARAVGLGFAQSNASKLHARPEIQARIHELQDELAQIDIRATERAAAKLAITRERVLEELAKIAFASMADYIDWIEDGQVDFAKLDRLKAAAIQTLTVDVMPTGHRKARMRRIRIKLADKRAALVDIGKHLGMFSERQPSDNPFTGKSDEQLDGEIRIIVARLYSLGFGRGAGERAQGAGGGEGPSPSAPAPLELQAVPEAEPLP